MENIEQNNNEKYNYTLEERNKLFEKDADGAFINLVIPSDYIKQIMPKEEMLENKEIKDLDLRGKKPEEYSLDEIVIMKKYSADIYKQTDLTNLEKQKSIDENRVFLQLIKNKDNEEITITIFEGGKVYIDLNSNGVSQHSEGKIDFVNELESHLDMCLPLLKKYYTNSEDKSYIVAYKDVNFYSYDLYIDIYVMIKNNRSNLLSIYKKADEERKKEILIEKVKQLDKLESEKNKIDLSDVPNNKIFVDQKDVIDFKLKDNNNFYLGQSRFFSEYIDIPEDMVIPDVFEFVGQINLNEFSELKNNNLLPKEGMLYFFQSPFELNGHIYENGIVLYSKNMNLIRKEANISKDMIHNYSLSDIIEEKEKFSDRYKKDDDYEYYDSFEGEDKNKIYGFYTDCQMSDSDIKKVSDKYIVLLQLGSEIYGEGVTTYLITEDDLKNQNFENVVYKYTQS